MNVHAHEGDDVHGTRASRAIARMGRLSHARPGLVTALCFVVACSFPLVVFARVVVGGKTLSTAQSVPGINGFDPPPGAPDALPNLYQVDAGASAWTLEPWTELDADAYERGEWPLWNPYQGAGKPHAANGISASFDPLLFAVRLDPTQRTMDLSIIAAFMLGSGAMFLYLVSSLRLRRIAALAGAAAFSLSGFFAVHSGNHLARGYVFLPILFLLVDRVLTRRSPPWVVALGVALALLAYTGHPEILILVMGVTAAYALYCLAFVVSSEVRWHAFRMLCAAGALGIALAVPLLTIFLHYQNLSYNIHKPGSGAGDESYPARFLGYWAIPYLTGTPVSTYGLGAALGTWLGAALLTSVGLVLAATRRLLVGRRIPFFLGVAALLVWKAYGLPGSGWVGDLPILERITFPMYGATIAGFGLACAGASGIDALLRGQLRKRALLIVTGVCVVVFVVALVANRSRIELYSKGATWEWVGFAAGCSSAVLLAAWASRAWRARRVMFGILAAIVIIGEVLVLFPKSSFQQRIDPYREPAWVELARDGRPAGTGTSRVFALDSKLFPETATAVQLSDIRSIDALYPKRYIDYIQAFVSPRVKDRFVGSDIASPERATRYDGNPMFDLTGVQFVFGTTSDPTSVVQALDRTPDRQRFERSALELASDVRDAAIVESGDELRVELPTGASASELHFSYAAVPSDDVTAPATFVVEGADAGGTRVSLSREELPAASPDRSVWNDRVLDLRTAGSPQELVLRFEDPSGGRGAWADLYFTDDDGHRIGGQYRLDSTVDGVGVYENLGVLPRAFIVRQVERVTSEAAAIRTLRATGSPFQGTGTLVERFDPARQAVVEGGRDAAAAVDPDCPQQDGGDAAAITSYAPHEVRIRVDAACAGLLVLTDTYFPDWQATVDGRDVDVLPTDVLFRGVVVPAGRSTVVFRYESSRFEIGVWIAIAAATVAAVWLVLWALRRRRERANAEA